MEISVIQTLTSMMTMLMTTTMMMTWVDSRETKDHHQMMMMTFREEKDVYLRQFQSVFVVMDWKLYEGTRREEY